MHDVHMMRDARLSQVFIYKWVFTKTPFYDVRAAAQAHNHNNIVVCICAVTNMSARARAIVVLLTHLGRWF